MIFFLSYESILNPAFISTKVKCFPERISEEEARTIFIAGEFRETSNGTSIIINVPEEFPELRKEVLKHENIHQVQFNQNRLFNCPFFGILSFTNELEANIGEKLNDKTYRRIYGDYGL